MNRVALLSMDVEDWYHLEYFRGGAADRGTSMLDGVDRFRGLLAEEGVPATFFVLGEVAEAHPSLPRELAAAGHEVASHGPDHRLLGEMSTAAFVEQLRAHKEELEQRLGAPVAGYRAPCFSMDREKLERLAGLGFRYDSSWARVASHPLYGAMDLSDWREAAPGVYVQPGTGLLEFSLPVVRVRSTSVPVGGGAYFRFFPWPATQALLRRFFAWSGVYVFYIHPFECSARRLAGFPAGTSAATRARFQLGRRAVLPRLRRLIALLRADGFAFETFSQAHARLSA